MYYISSFLLIPNGSRVFPVSMRYVSLAFCTLTYSIKRAREIRKFHVAVVQQRLIRACLHGVGDPGLVGLVSFVFTLWGTQNKRNLPH